MGFTTNYQIPFPELGDLPDGAGQMKALATQVDSQLKSQINAPLQTWTPTFTGFTLGNGIVANAVYRKVGGLCFIHLRINAAATSPTTAFVGAMVISLPIASSGYPTVGMGTALWTSSGAGRLGYCQCSTSATNTWEVMAVKQTDLTVNTPASIWGTATWAVGTTLNAALVYPI